MVDSGLLRPALFFGGEVFSGRGGVGWLDMVDCGSSIFPPKTQQTSAGQVMW